MASTKQYAYYLEGNQIAIVEKDTSFDNNVDSRDYSPGIARQEWKSPQSTIVDGLEVKYTYLKDYRLMSSRHIGWNLTSTTDERNTSVYSPAYGEISGYLTFFFPAIAANNGILDMSALNDGRNIVVHNHLFSGKHKIKVASAQGYIQTHTKWSSGLNKLEEDDDGPNPVFNATETILQSGATSFNHGFSAGDYIFNTTAMGNTDNQGLFKIAELSSDGTTVTVDKNYYSDTTTSGDLASVDAALQGETFTGGNLFIPQVLLSQGAYVDVTAVNFMEDETFELDLPSYLNQALIYYVRAKELESQGEIEGYAYNMAEFKRIVEKHSSSREIGPKIIQGFWGMR